MSYPRSILVFFVLLLPCLVRGQTKAPDSLSFQGRLTDPGGIPIDTPSIGMTFKLYKNGSQVWSETHPAVAVENGVFNVLLGGTTSLDTMAFNTPLDLGITVNGDSEISPRTPLAAAAYAKALPGLYTFFRDDGLNQSYNVVGGAANNVVGSGVTGATIGGGGGQDVFATPFMLSPNNVLADFGTIGGGGDNTASGRSSTIGGGLGNTASGIYSTVGGGHENTASATGSTVAGGRINTASNSRSTVGGGQGNTASGGRSIVGGGENNKASGEHSTVPGGIENRAAGDYSFAAGHDAKARHEGTFVWNDRSITSDNDSLLSTGPNQFLIRAAGGVGIGTAVPLGDLHVSGGENDAVFVLEADTSDNDENANPMIQLRQDDGKIGFNIGFDTPNLGNNIFGINRRQTSTDLYDTFVIDAADGDVAIGVNSSTNRLYVQESINGTGTDPANYVARIRNSSAGGGADVLALEIEANNPSVGANFVGFFDADSLIGQIEGAGNAVSYNTMGADYAEYLPMMDPEETMGPGDVVGVFENGVSRTTEGAIRVMAVSSNASVVGNMPKGGYDAGFAKIAFVGQIPVRVKGAVNAGDYVVASGRGDGFGRAVDPSRLTLGDVDAVVGRAWSSTDAAGQSEVMVEVGLDRSALLVEIIKRQDERLARLEGLFLGKRADPAG